MLRVVGRMKGTYVIALLDCCREKIDFTKWRGSIKKAKIPSDLEVMFEAQDMIQQTHDTNYLVTYGCEPSRGVPSKSTIAVAYFKFLN